MDIMLTVSYSLKIPKDEFFHPETGDVKGVSKGNCIDGRCRRRKKASDTLSPD